MLVVAGAAVMVLVLVQSHAIWRCASAFEAPAESVWKPDNRIVLREYVAPDSSSKIGVYTYDAGALGCTTLNVSLVEVDREYPIEANLFKTDKVPEAVTWAEANEAVIRIPPDYARSIGETAPPPDVRIGRVSVHYELAKRER